MEKEVIPYAKNPEKYIMMPGYAKRRHPIVEERTKALAAYAETSPPNRWEKGDGKLGVITSGTAYQYVREALGENVASLSKRCTVVCNTPVPEY